MSKCSSWATRRTPIVSSHEELAGLKPSNFTAMMRLDHNRSRSQIAQKIGKPVGDVHKVTVWGNHSATHTPTSSRRRPVGRKYGR